MLTHVIMREPPVRKKQMFGSDKSERFTGEYGSEDHKRFIHKRCLLRGNHLSVGDKVTIKGQAGIVCDILGPEEFDKVEWGSSLECKCIEVMIYGEEATCLLHPKMMRRIEGQ